MNARRRTMSFTWYPLWASPNCHWCLLLISFSGLRTCEIDSSDRPPKRVPLSHPCSHQSWHGRDTYRRNWGLLWHRGTRLWHTALLYHVLVPRHLSCETFVIWRAGASRSWVFDMRWEANEGWTARCVVTYVSNDEWNVGHGENIGLLVELSFCSCGKVRGVPAKCQPAFRGSWMMSSAVPLGLLAKQKEHQHNMMAYGFFVRQF